MSYHIDNIVYFLLNVLHYIVNPWERFTVDQKKYKLHIPYNRFNRYNNRINTSANSLYDRY